MACIMMGRMRCSLKLLRVIRALILLSIVVVGAESRGAEESSVPNFVIIVLDDASWNDFGAYGNPGVKTPIIDQLARDGMRFDSAFVATSSCSPSRASLLTARYPHNTGAQELESPLPGSAVIFPSLLRDAGYYTAAAGKWHLGDATRPKFDKIYRVSDSSGGGDWVKALADRPRDQPFMLWLAAIDPHRPWSGPPLHSPDEVVVPPFLADRPGTRNDLARYYDEISRADETIGKVLDELVKQGVEKETVVILLSDNGRPFPRSKTSLYDSGVKTPFIIRWPARMKAGAVNSNLISAIDIAPTILELAGIESPPEFQGKSFRKTLFDPSVSIRDYVIVERNAHGAFGFERGIRSRDFLYIQNLFPVRHPCYLRFRPDDATKDLMALMRKKALPSAQSQCFASPRPLEELYDIRSDPFSLHNLVSDLAHAGVLGKLRRELSAWSVATADAIDVTHCGARQQISCNDRPEVMQRKKRLAAILAGEAGTE
jgi:N-sulfoglucosamine sulfohydrolase